MWELEIPLMKFIGTLASVLTLKSILVVLCSPDWILSKCNSPRFAQSHDKLSTLDLTSECILRWEWGCVKENFLCTTNFNKFVDCGSHTEPKEAFVMWPESLLTVNRCRTGQAVIKKRRSESKGETCLLVLAMPPHPHPRHLLQTLNCLPCA